MSIQAAFASSGGGAMEKDRWRRHHPAHDAEMMMRKRGRGGGCHHFRPSSVVASSSAAPRPRRRHAAGSPAHRKRCGAHAGGSVCRGVVVAGAGSTASSRLIPICCSCSIRTCCRSGEVIVVKVAPVSHAGLVLKGPSCAFDIIIVVVLVSRLIRRMAGCSSSVF